MDIEKELTHVAFLNREYQVSHLAYDREMAFFKAIQRGDLETVTAKFDLSFYYHRCISDPLLY